METRHPDSPPSPRPAQRVSRDAPAGGVASCLPHRVWIAARVEGLVRVRGSCDCAQD